MWHRRVEPSFLAEVVPPRGLEDGMSAARAMLGALAGEALSLEVTVTPSGRRWYVRSATADGLERALAQLRVVYPQAVIEPIDGLHEADPAALAGGEQAVAVPLLPWSEAVLPLRLDWRHERDPLSGVLAVAAPTGSERVVARLSVAAAPRGSADRIRRRQEQRFGRRADYPATVGPSLMPIVVLMALGAAVLQGWRWYEAGEWALLAGTGASAFIVVPLLAAIAVRLFRAPEPLAPNVVAAKLGAPLVSAELSVLALGPDVARSRALATQMAAAYAAFDDAAGGGLRPGAAKVLRGSPRSGRPLLLNTAEAAALWHLPAVLDAPLSVRRTTAQRLAPAPGHVMSGVRVGRAPTGGTLAPVFLPEPLLHRNHFIVAKTRRGKSTLLRHMAAGIMERVAADIEGTALVVVDPHQDLAEAVLASVPDALVDRTVYLDFAHLERPIGLNLIDVALFPDRDRTVEGIVTIMNRLWPANWGPRMEGALRASLAALHELNTRRSRVEQFTLLDVAPFLTDPDLREALLLNVQDPAIQAWWRDNYTFAGQTLQQQTANPVTSKIGRFTVTEASRLVLGQPRSTFDPREVIRDGGVLVINTAVGTLGEGAASLVGATMLNLLGLLVEEQVALPPAQRRRVVELVDESSTLGAVDYPRMLSELGKYGASFTLVTQSLAKLDAIDRELVPTILSNCDGLTTFQCSAEDARRLLPELGSGLEVEDLVSLDDFSAYARWWDGFARPPAFTLNVDPPPAHDPERVVALAQRSAERHGRPREVVSAEVRRVIAERSRQIRRGKRARTRKGQAPKRNNAGTAPTAKVNAPATSDASDKQLKGEE